MSNCCCPPVIISNGGGTPPPADPLCISPGSETALTIDGDGCLGLTTDPDGPVRPGPDGLTVCLSEQEDNTLTQDEDGCLYVPPPEAAPVCVSEEEDNTAALDDAGCVYVPLPQVQMTAQMLVYEEDGEFNPADYPGLQYIRVRAVGGGGGGSAVRPVDYGTDVAVGMAGGGGSYAESLFNAADLPAGPIPFVVGQGGAAANAEDLGEPAGGHTIFGQPEGGSLLDSLLLAVAGQGGRANDNDPSDPDGTPGNGPKDFGAWRGQPNYDHASGLLVSVGQITVPGGNGGVTWALGASVLGAGQTLAVGGSGGGNPLSGAVASEVTIHRDGGPGYVQGVSTQTGTIRYGAGGNARVSGTAGTSDGTGYAGHAGVLVIEVVQLTVTAA